MVDIACWYCIKNTGNKTCEMYPEGIPSGENHFHCKGYRLMTVEEAKEKIAKGIETTWYVQDEDWDFSEKDLIDTDDEEYEDEE